jgi:hypothetical protein
MKSGASFSWHTFGFVLHLLFIVTEVVQASPQTGVDLEAIDIAGTPEWWFLEEAASGKGAARVEGRWGFTPVPPGDYRVFVLPQGERALPIVWDTVTVVKGKARWLKVDSGIMLSGSSHWTTPPQWWFVDDAEGERVAQVRGRWGFTPLPAGSYRLTIVPKGEKSLPVDWGSIEVRASEVSRLALASGIELKPGAFEGQPPEWWFVDDTQDERVAQIGQRWGFTPLPPGRYTVEMPFGYATGEASVDVLPDQVSQIAVADLGVGRLVVELPAAQEVSLIGAPGQFEFGIKRDNKIWSIPLPKGERTERVVLDLEAGSLELIFRNGVMEVARSVRVEAGREISLPFDIVSLATEKGLSVFTLGDDDAEIAAGELLVARSTTGEPLMLQNVTGGSTWLALGNVYLRWRVGDAETVIRELPIADPVSVPTPSLPGSSGLEGRVWVDVVIQSPSDGAVVETEQVELVGRAATGSEAGTTQIAVLIDTSGSTNDLSGVDVDDDGKEETVLEAEVAAARRLVDELKRIEAASPGDAFAVGLLRFSDNAEQMAPITPFSTPQVVERLGEALDRLLERGPGGDTYYDRGLDAAVDTIEGAGLRGPRIVLLMSDGKPSDLKAALAAATRTGQARTMVHTLGLGKDFKGNVPPKASFPPYPSTGVDILGLIAALAHTGSEVFPLPRPGDVVAVIPRLPVLEPVEAALKTVLVENVTTGRSAEEVSVATDGSFVAVVPVSLLPMGEHQGNTLEATAIALDEVSRASDEVRVKAPPMTAETERLVKELTDCTRARHEVTTKISEIATDLERCRQTNVTQKAEFDRAIGGAQKAVETCADEKRQLSKVLEESKSSLARCNSRLADLERVNNDLLNQTERCELHAAELEQALQKEKETLVDCDAERNALDDTRADLQERLRLQQEACANENNQLRAKLKQAQTDKRAVELRLESAQFQLEGTRVQLEKQRNAHSRWEQQKRVLEERTEDAEAEVVRLQALLDELQSNLESLEPTLEEERARIAQLEEENADLTKALERCPKAPGRLRVTATSKGGVTPEHLLPTVELILDVSNSMWGRIDGEPKINVARKVMQDVVSRLPNNIRLALRVFGHRNDYREAGACTDSELLIPLATLNRERLMGQVNALHPRGKTPIAYSLQQVTKDFADIVGQKIVVLVTDGEEECGGDPLQAASQLAMSGLDVILHVVGFALTDDSTKETLKRVAEATQGRFIDAQSPRELEEALSKSLRVPYRVLDADGVVKAEGHVDHDAIELPPGEYRIMVSAPRGLINVDGVKVASGETTLLSLDTALRGEDAADAASEATP